MAKYVVKCIVEDNASQYNDCRGIDQIGFPAEEGGIAYRTPPQVYDIVEKQGDTVVVQHEGSETEVHGATYNGTKYVKTEPNNTTDDNLLKQPSC